MLRRLFPVRRSERRDALTAALFLFVFVAGHSILEATRDALFLAKIPAARLPWVYVALAIVALLATRAQSVFQRVTPRRVLIGWTVFAAVGTVGLCAALPLMRHVGLYVFYIWSGVISTIVFIHFWSLVGGLFSIRQAKRLYGTIGLGAGLGAIVGSAAAGLVTTLSPVELALAASALFIVAAVLPFFFTSGGSEERSKSLDRSARQDPLLDRLRSALGHPYTRRVLLVSSLVTIAVTLSDFSFKSYVSAHFAADELVTWFGRINFALNATSVCVQVFAVRALVAKLPLPFVFALMPLGLAAGGVGLAVTGTLAAAIVTKAVDGSFRFSVYRTSAELLLVPLSEGARSVAKSLMDVIGQRGAQMVGSLVILVAVLVDASPHWIAGLLALAAVGATVGAVMLRKDYAQLFKDSLSSGRTRFAQDFARLDMRSLESLLTSLDSESDAEILGALEVLDREGKVHTVPGLILYHPSDAVVVAALRIFTLRGRKVPMHALAHLDRRSSIRVRAEAMAARAVLAPDPAMLAEQYTRETSPDVRAAIVATRAVFGMTPEPAAHAELASIVASGSVDSRRVVAEIVGGRRAVKFEAELVALARAPEPEVKRAAIQALGAIGTDSAADALVDLLEDAQVGADVRLALVGAGAAGAAALHRALRDVGRGRAVRRLVPGLFVELDAPEGARALLENLRDERDGMVRYRSILALGRIVSLHPEVALDRELLQAELQRTVARAYRYLDRVVALRRGCVEAPERETPGHHLLLDLLKTKQRHMVGRVFRLLALLEPEEDIDAISSSIERNRPSAERAGALELIHLVLKNPVRDAVIGLVDDLPEDERRSHGSAFHEAEELEYEAVIAQMLASTSGNLRKFAAFHVAELRMVSQQEAIEALAQDDADTGDFRRALKALSQAKEHRRAS